MTDYRCALGHESASPKPLTFCPHMVAGHACPEPIHSGYYTAAGKWVAR